VRRPPGLPRLVVVKQDFARLTLGMFATSFPATAARWRRRSLAGRRRSVRCERSTSASASIS